MTEITSPAFRKHPDQALAALETLEPVLASLGGESEVTDLLRLVPGQRAVFRGHFAGRDAVFRLPLDEPNRSAFRTEWAELRRVSDYMSQPPNAVAKPLEHDPVSGLQITAFVPGTPLLDLIGTFEPGRQISLVHHGARWLEAYTAPTIDWAGINPRNWQRKAKETAAQQPHPSLHAIEHQILRKMSGLGRLISGGEWRVGVTHGDFHLNNLIHCDGGLFGIDIGGPGRLPIYKDMARAMTHMTRRIGALSGQRHFGVDAKSYQVFVNTFDLSNPERELFLPFMIAFESLIRVERPEMPETRLTLAHEMAESLLGDLKQIV